MNRKKKRIVFSKTHIELMESIKRVFDANHILNPEKIFPDEEVYI